MTTNVNLLAGKYIFLTPPMCCVDHHCRILKERGNCSGPPHAFNIFFKISYNIPNIGKKALRQGSRQFLLSNKRDLQLPLRSVASLGQLSLGRGLQWACQFMCAYTSPST